jgi:hypothetical protein
VIGIGRKSSSSGVVMEWNRWHSNRFRRAFSINTETAFRRRAVSSPKIFYSQIKFEQQKRSSPMEMIQTPDSSSAIAIGQGKTHDSFFAMP